jgi:hypothetical protein
VSLEVVSGLYLEIEVVDEVVIDFPNFHEVLKQKQEPNEHAIDCLNFHEVSKQKLEPHAIDCLNFHEISKQKPEPSVHRIEDLDELV